MVFFCHTKFVKIMFKVVIKDEIFRSVHKTKQLIGPQLLETLLKDQKLIKKDKFFHYLASTGN